MTTPGSPSADDGPGDRPGTAPGNAPAGAPTGAELIGLAERAAAEAAALLAEGATRPRATVDTKSSATDLVTEMDRAAEALVVETILGARPDDGVLGEEGASRPGTSGVRWVIDPLDGTTNYVYGHPGVGVSVAAQVAGTTVAGCVIDVVTGDRYRAVAGGGAERNGAPITTSTRTDLARALVATGFGYDAAARAAQGRLLAAILADIRDIRRVGAAALDLCSVACGRVDAFYELTLSPWDYAAGALIASEAGAVVCDLDGQFPTGPVVLAAPPALIGPLRDLLLAGGAEAP